MIFYIGDLTLKHAPQSGRLNYINIDQIKTIIITNRQSKYRNQALKIICISLAVFICGFYMKKKKKKFTGPLAFNMLKDTL